MLDHEFELKPSKIHQAVFAALLLLSGGIVFFLPLIIGLKMMMLILLACYGVYWWRQIHALLRIRRTSEGRWLLQTQKRVFEGVLRGDSTVTSIVSILRFQVPGQYFVKSYVIFCDTLTTDRYRQLLVMVRMY